MGRRQFPGCSCERVLLKSGLEGGMLMGSQVKCGSQFNKESEPFQNSWRVLRSSTPEGASKSHLHIASLLGGVLKYSDQTFNISMKIIFMNKNEKIPPFLRTLHVRDKSGWDCSCWPGFHGDVFIISSFSKLPNLIELSFHRTSSSFNTYQICFCGYVGSITAFTAGRWMKWEHRTHTHTHSLGKCEGKRFLAEFQDEEWQSLPWHLSERGGGCPAWCRETPC